MNQGHAEAVRNWPIYTLKTDFEPGQVTKKGEPMGDKSFIVER